jgi:hypothetical protein
MPSRLLSTAAGFLLVASAVRGAASPPCRVGQIFVVGNESTPQCVILRRVPLFPGDVLNPGDLRRAENNLARLPWLFVVNKDVHPTVQILDPKRASEYKDILVTVQERRLTPHLWRCADAAEAAFRFECARRVIGPLAAVPGVTDCAMVAAGGCASIALKLIRGEPEEALAVARYLGSPLPWVGLPATSASPETPAPPR